MESAVKFKTAELEGALLNEAVALALGLSSNIKVSGRPVYRVPTFIDCPSVDDFCGDFFEPSERWDHGGPILENLIASGFDVHPEYGRDGSPAQAFWCANADGDSIPYSRDWSREYIAAGGASVLVAAMRAFVASKLGEEVELP